MAHGAQEGMGHNGTRKLGGGPKTNSPASRTDFQRMTLAFHIRASE
jgi:hypothetical protein